MLVCQQNLLRFCGVGDAVDVGVGTGVGADVGAGAGAGTGTDDGRY